MIGKIIINKYSQDFIKHVWGRLHMSINVCFYIYVYVSITFTVKK